jgi:hypothetical protein
MLRERTLGSFVWLCVRVLDDAFERYPIASFGHWEAGFGAFYVSRNQNLAT